MSLFSSRSPFDDQVDEATSELIPNGEENLGLNFEICDQIRGKLVGPKDAMRALKRRLNHPNPNVQLLTLKLTDLCIKNGGDHFLVEIASQEFTSTLAALVRNHQLPHQVRTPLLKDFQAWARAFRNRHNLENMYSTYVQLRNEGYPFPPGDDNALPTRAVFDTSVPPEWSDSPVCERCRTQFTFTNRKHHCRACGHTFCGECSSKNIALPHLGIPMPVRVCDGCFARGGKSQAAVAVAQQQQQQQLPGKPATGSGPQLNRKEQEDLDLAIALSLAEADKQPAPSSSSSSNARQSQNQQAATTVVKAPVTRQQQQPAETDEDDPDLAAAISASLAELELAKSKRPGATTAYRTDPAWSPQRKPSSVSSTTAIREHNTGSSSIHSTTTPAAAAAPERDTLSATEMETIDLFAAAMAKLDAAGPGAAQALIANREYAALHQSMAALHPRVVAQVHDTLAVHKQLEEMHDKLTRAVRAYEEAVDARLRMPPAGAGPGGYAQVPPHQMHQSQPQPQPGYEAYMQQPGQGQYPPPQPQGPGPYGPPAPTAYGGMPPQPYMQPPPPPMTSATPTPQQPYMGGPPQPGYPPTSTMSPPPPPGVSQAPPQPQQYPPDPNVGYAAPPQPPGSYAPPAPVASYAPGPTPTPAPQPAGPNYAYGQPPAHSVPPQQAGFMPGLMPPLMPAGSASPPPPAAQQVQQPPKEMPPLIDLS